MDTIKPKELTERDRILNETMRKRPPIRRLEEVMGRMNDPGMDQELAAFEKMRAERRARERAEAG